MLDVWCSILHLEIIYPFAFCSNDAIDKAGEEKLCGWRKLLKS